ncbi:MAG: ATP-binding protein [Candidatus Paceibacterota bacterium]
MINNILLEEKKAKKLKALHKSESRFRRLFEAAQDGILILNATTGQIEEVNPFLIDILGYSREEILGKKLWEVGTFPDETKSKEAFETIQKEGYVRYENLPLQTKEGLLIRVEFVSNLYKVEGKEVIQCNIRDITERKKMEAIIEQRRVILEHKLRSELIADITHELRTPLTIMRGNIDLAKLDKSKEKLSGDFLSLIDTEILELADMLSDLTLLTSNRHELERRINSEKINLTHIIKHAVKRCATLASNKKITIKFTDVRNSNIMGDKILIEKLFLNIIKNAITYGKEGGKIEIFGSRKILYIKIFIKDDGIGIAKNDLSNIFERFYRVDKSRTRGDKESRTGLGLSISKWIVEAHGGTITVESIEKKGSTFTMSFPVT